MHSFNVYTLTLKSEWKDKTHTPSDKAQAWDYSPVEVDKHVLV